MIRVPFLDVTAVRAGQGLEVDLMVTLPNITNGTPAEWGLGLNLASFHRPSPVNLGEDLLGAANRVRNGADRGWDVQRAVILSQLPRR